MTCAKVPCAYHGVAGPEEPDLCAQIHWLIAGAPRDALRDIKAFATQRLNEKTPVGVGTAGVGGSDCNG